MADTLYETIGGSLRVNAAVTLFYEKVFADDSLEHFFDGVDAQGLSARQSMFVSMLRHFRAALDEVKVQPDRVVEIMALLESTRNNVLGRSQQGA